MFVLLHFRSEIRYLCISLSCTGFGIVLAYQKAKHTETGERMLSRRKDVALMLTGAVLGASL